MLYLSEDLSLVYLYRPTFFSLYDIHRKELIVCTHFFLPGLHNYEYVSTAQILHSLSL